MKNKIFTIARILVAVGLLAFLFSNIDVVQFWNKLKSARVDYAFLGFSMYFIIALLAIIRWKLLLKVHDIKPNFAKLCKLFFIGSFFNNAMPGATGGDIIKGYYIAKETATHKPEAVTTVFIDRIVGIVSLLLIGIIALMFNLSNPVMRQLAISVAVVFGMMCIFFPLFFSKRVMRKVPFIEKILEVLPFKQTILRIYHTFYKYKSHLDIIFYGIILSMVLQVISIMMVAVLGLSISLNSVKLIYYFMFIPVIATVSALPVSVSGLGVNEGLYAYCFGLVGATSEDAIAIALMGRLVTILWSLPGWFFYMTMSDKKVSEEMMQKEIKSLEKEI